MPDVKFSQLLAQSPASVAAGAKLWTHQGHILGMRPEFVSPTSLRVSSGSVYIPSLGYAIEFPAAVTKGGLAPSGTSHYYMYVFLNGSTPDLEISTTAPAAPYIGSARCKTGDTSRRFIGAALANGSGGFWNFVFDNGRVLYKNTQDATAFRKLAGGTSTTEATVALGSCIPPTTKSAIIRFNNVATAGNAYTGTSDDSAAGPPTSGILSFVPGGNAIADHVVDSSQAITYWYATTPTGAGFFIDVCGYTLER